MARHYHIIGIPESGKSTYLKVLEEWLLESSKGRAGYNCTFNYNHSDNTSIHGQFKRPLFKRASFISWKTKFSFTEQQYGNENVDASKISGVILLVDFEELFSTSSENKKEIAHRLHTLITPYLKSKAKIAIVFNKVECRIAEDVYLEQLKKLFKQHHTNTYNIIREHFTYRFFDVRLFIENDLVNPDVTKPHTTQPAGLFTMLEWLTRFPIAHFED